MPDTDSPTWVLRYDQFDQDAHLAALSSYLDTAVEYFTAAAVPVPGYLAVDSCDPAAVADAIGALRDAAADDEHAAHAWDEVSYAAECLDGGCSCAYDWVNEGRSYAADSLGEWVAEQRAAGVSWWVEDLGPLRELDLQALLYRCHRGRGHTGFELSVYRDGRVQVSCAGSVCEAFALRGELRRELLEWMDNDFAPDSDLVVRLRDADEVVVELAHQLVVEAAEDDHALAALDALDAAEACFTVAA